MQRALMRIEHPNGNVDIHSLRVNVPSSLDAFCVLFTKYSPWIIEHMRSVYAADDDEEETC